MVGLRLFAGNACSKLESTLFFSPQVVFSLVGDLCPQLSVTQSAVRRTCGPGPSPPTRLCSLGNGCYEYMYMIDLGFICTLCTYVLVNTYTYIRYKKRQRKHFRSLEYSSRTTMYVGKNCRVNCPANTTMYVLSDDERIPE